MPTVGEENTMTLSEAKSFIGKEVEVGYTDRHGNTQIATAFLVDVHHVPMYGTSLLFDFGDVGLDRVTTLRDNGRAAA